MNIKNINSFVVSNIGNVRTNHEDNFFIPKSYYIDSFMQTELLLKDTIASFDYYGKDGIFVVCDGMGGHNGGEVASRMAVEAVLSKYNTLLKSDKEGLLAFIRILNNDIYEKSIKEPSCSNMGSTFSGLVIFDDNVSLLHIGDSRIYKVENDELVQVSKDHTEGRRLVDAGIIKIEELSNFSNRKLLYKYLGRKGNLVADYENIRISAKTRFIIASDGLTDTLSENEIKISAISFGNPKDVCHSLLNNCLNKNQACNDNVTIICIDIEI